MTTRTEFEAIFETMELDATLAPDDTIRRTPAQEPTLAMRDLPAVDFAATTNPELELRGTLGEGGMGIVRLATQRALVRDVAVKTLRDDRRTEDAHTALLHEALVTGGLEHPNVIPIYTLGQTPDGAPVIVMKRVQGTPWDACIDAGRAPPGFEGDDPLEWQLEIFTQVCLATHFAHSRGIVHRDIKPENVMIGDYGEVYLLDWGIAVTIDEEKAEYLPWAGDSTGVSGTPHYMAPEMTHGDGRLISERTDVYLLGATLFHAITGRPPHDGDSLFEIMYRAHESTLPELEDVPDELRDIVGRAMAKDPEERYASADELRRAIVDFQRHRSSIALADEASESLEELALLTDGGDEEDEAAIRNLFGECRFGFRQALRVWPENAEAADGLREAVETMARFEIACENAGAASALLDDLDSEHPELRADLSDLEQRLAKRREEFQELRRMQEESDLSEGAGGRAVAAIVMGVVWTIFPFVAEWAVDTGRFEITGLAYLVHGFGLSAFTLLVVWAIRGTAFANRANRSLMRMVISVSLVLPFYRFIAWHKEIPPLDSLTLEAVLWATTFIALGILSNRLAWVGGCAFLAAGVIGTLFPQWVFTAYAVANAIALVWLYYIWRPGEDDCHPSITGPA